MEQYDTGGYIPTINGIAVLKAMSKEMPQMTSVIREKSGVAVATPGLKVFLKKLEKKGIVLRETQGKFILWKLAPDYKKICSDSWFKKYIPAMEEVTEDGQ